MFDELKAELAANTEVVESAIALIQGLADKLDEAKDYPEQVAAIVTELRAEKEKLANAVAENTIAG